MPRRLPILLSLGLLLTFIAGPKAAEDGKNVDKLLTEAKRAFDGGRADEALKLAGRAIEADPKSVAARFLRGSLHEALNRHVEAIADFDRVIELDRRNADAYDHRGSEQFKLGKIDGSIADFDKAIELDPARERAHWKRGISYYYAGKFDEGLKQFEGYQTFDDNDVENAVWRYLCMARGDGVEKAVHEILKIKDDRRVPMMQVYALYAGKAGPDDMLSAARAGDPPPEELNRRLFYAELYLGLYHETAGRANEAREHIEAAVGHKIGHYMWDVARVHAELLNHDVISESDIEFANPDGQHLQLNLARPKTGEGPFPAVICIHGGGFRAGTRQGYDGLCVKLAQRGYVAATVSYRLAPKYQFPAAVHDVKAAVRWLRANADKYHVAPDRIGVTGGSAGGHLAQFLGVTQDVAQFEGDSGNLDQSSHVACVVNYYGPSDLTKSYGKSVDAAEVLPLFLGGNVERQRRRHILASPLYWVTPEAAPTLCIHGTDDPYVAHEQAEWIVERLKAAEVEAELLTLEGAGHGFKGAHAERAEAAMFAFFEKHLKRGR